MSAFEEYMNMSSEAYEAGGPEFYKDNLIEEGYASGYVDGVQETFGKLVPYLIAGGIFAIGWCCSVGSAAVRKIKEKRKLKLKEKERINEKQNF